MKKGSIHTVWMTWFVSFTLIATVLYSTGHLDFLISKDTIGIGFSLFLVLTLLVACRSQYRSFKQYNKNHHAIVHLHQKLKNSQNYDADLAKTLNSAQSDVYAGTSVGTLLTDINRMIKLNPNDPLSQGNLDAVDFAVDENFLIETSDEVEQSMNLSILGMLGTFIGILWGFAMVDWSTVSPDDAFSVIIHVMSGISIALITSILGILFSMFLNKMHKRLYARHRQSYLVVSNTLQDMSRVLCYKNGYQKLVQQLDKGPQNSGKIPLSSR